MKNQSSTLFFIFLIFGVPALCYGDNVVNGGFESPELSDPNLIIQDGTGVLTGWTVSDGSGIDLFRTFGGQQPAEGNQFVSLNWAEPTTISQTLSTVASQDYLLSFSLATELPDASQTIRTVEVLWGGNTVDSFSLDPSGRTNANMGWQSFDYIVSGAGSDVLSFVSTTPGAFGPAIDAVSVTAVPEPSTILMLCLATLPACLKRRPRSAA